MHHLSGGEVHRRVREATRMPRVPEDSSRVLMQRPQEGRGGRDFGSRGRGNELDERVRTIGGKDGRRLGDTGGGRRTSRSPPPTTDPSIGEDERHAKRSRWGSKWGPSRGPSESQEEQRSEGGRDAIDIGAFVRGTRGERGERERTRRRHEVRGEEKEGGRRR